MPVEPDPKPAAPYRDPELLAEIHQAWQPFGCSVCGYKPSPAAGPGGQIEVHHILPRGRGGEDSWENTLGLCGELCPQKCHWRVTTERLSIDYVTDVGWVWTDRVSGEEGICRVLSAEAQALSREVGRFDVQRALDLVTQDSKHAALDRSKLPDLARVPGREGAEARFLFMQQLWKNMNADYLTLALFLQNARQQLEWSTLGFGSMTEYAEAMNIPSPTLSKCLAVADIFRGNWLELSSQDQSELTLDRLWYAGRLWQEGVYETVEVALHEAVAAPQRYLYDEYRATKAYDHPDGITHRCPDCGDTHVIRLPGTVERDRRAGARAPKGIWREP